MMQVQQQQVAFGEASLRRKNGSFKGRQVRGIGAGARGFGGAASASRFGASSPGIGWNTQAVAQSDARPWNWRQSQQRQPQQQQQQEARRPQQALGPQSQQDEAKLQQTEQDGVPVYVRGLPNNLCNSVCMEAILEQASLDTAIVSCEAWPGSPCGEAVLRLATWDAATRAARHFHGCRWDSTGAAVVVEVGGLQPQLDPWCASSVSPVWDSSVAADPNVSAAAPGVWQVDDAVAADAEQQPTTPKACHDSKPFEAITKYNKNSYSSVVTNGRVDQAAATKEVEARARAETAEEASPTRASATKASPALSAASTAFPAGSPSPLASPALSAAAFRKVSWADLASDDEENTFAGATDQDGPSTESGSAGAGTSDDGF